MGKAFASMDYNFFFGEWVYFTMNLGIQTLEVMEYITWDESAL